MLYSETGPTFPEHALAFGQAVNPAQEEAMAKGQMRSNKEKKKPKQDKNKKPKGGPAPSPFAAGQTGQPGQNPFGKKG
jgi:hypothetical protein